MNFNNKMFRNLKLLIRPFAPCRRSFSSLVQKRLFKALEKELEYEESQYKVDEGVAPFLKESGFEIVDMEGSNQVLLRRTVNGNHVEVSFRARSPYTADGENNEGEENQDEENPDNNTEFQVAIKKPGKSAGLIYECISSQSEIHISNIMYSEDVDSAEKSGSFINSAEYRGPDFSTLDEKLQAAFLEFLKAHGVNEDLSVFVETYSLDKEHRLYMGWIARMKAFIN